MAVVVIVSPFEGELWTRPVWLTPVARCFESAITANCSAYDHRI
jgi:hypothetical protein